MDLTGRRIGNYIVERLIGQGAMGSVWLASHETLFRKVAIKVILPELAQNPQLVERFIDEARQVSRLGHPALVQVLDFGAMPDGSRYSVMEYLEGADLEDVLRAAGPFAPARVVRLLADVADGLAVVHDAGIVHRDLKPANLFLAGTERGEMLKILDFGIAKLLDAPGRTKVGGILGTPRYISPEQARGAPIDARSDQYSFGVVLYELLAGAPPFTSENPMELLTLHIAEAPPPLAARAPHVPAALAAVVMRCLEKDPAQRFPDMRALRDALRAAVAPPRGRTGYVALAIGAAVLAIGGVALISMREPNPEPVVVDAPALAARTPTPPRPVTPAPAPDAAPAESSAIGRGAAIYQSMCARCHGRRGEGDGADIPPGLEPKSFADLGAWPGALDAYRFEIVRRGIEEGGRYTMPTFRDKLTEDETRDVVAFLATLAPPLPSEWAPREPRPEDTPELRARGARLFKQKCTSCHGPRGQGDGRARELLDRHPADLTAGVFKLRSTPKGSLPTDLDLFRTITRGMGREDMPSFARLPEADRWALVAHVKTLSPRFRRGPPPRPLKIPPRPENTGDAIARGHTAYLAAGCPKCHGYTGWGDGVRSTTLEDRLGQPVRPTDFRSARNFIGGSAPEDVYRTLMTGVDGTPMPQGSTRFSPDEGWDVVEFILTLRNGG